MSIPSARCERLRRLHVGKPGFQSWRSVTDGHTSSFGVPNSLPPIPRIGDEQQQREGKVVECLVQATCATLLQNSDWKPASPTPCILRAIYSMHTTILPWETRKPTSSAVHFLPRRDKRKHRSPRTHGAQLLGKPGDEGRGKADFNATEAKETRDDRHSLEDFVDLVDLRVSWEKRPFSQHLHQDGSDGPQIHRRGVCLRP